MRGETAVGDERREVKVLRCWGGERVVMEGGKIRRLCGLARFSLLWIPESITREEGEKGLTDVSKPTE